MITLSVYFSLQDFVSYFKKDLKSLSTIEKMRLGNAARNYFEGLAYAGILKLPEDNFNLHENKFIGALKRLLNKEAEHEDDNDAFAEFLMFQIAGAYHFPGTLDEQYLNFIQGVNSGEFFDIDFPRSDVCKKCGATLAMGAEDWKFSVYAYKAIREEDKPLTLDHESVKTCPGK